MRRHWPGPDDCARAGHCHGRRPGRVQRTWARQSLHPATAGPRCPSRSAHHRAPAAGAVDGHRAAPGRGPCTQPARRGRATASAGCRCVRGCRCGNRVGRTGAATARHGGAGYRAPRPGRLRLGTAAARAGKGAPASDCPVRPHGAPARGALSPGRIRRRLVKPLQVADLLQALGLPPSAHAAAPCSAPGADPDFSADIAHELAGIEQSLQDADAATLRHHAHRLQGTLQMCRAIDQAGTAAALWELGQQATPDWVEAWRLLQGLQQWHGSRKAEAVPSS